jgi:hypothetical protein
MKDAVLRKLGDDESASRIDWLSATWPPMEGGTGIDVPERWESCAWVLNAIYERDDLPDNLSYDDTRRIALDAGAEERIVVAGIDIDAVTTTPGVTLGFRDRPAPEWGRLSWSELGSRDGFGFWAVDGRWPNLRYTPQVDWADPGVIPVTSWPSTGPAGGSSWPVNLLPPTEGSLDEESLSALITVLSDHTPAESLEDCSFFYGAVPFMGDGATIYSGDLRDLPSFVRSQRGRQLTPSNIWPADRSWLVYTDYDLWATRVCGSAALIDAIRQEGALDAVQCG